MEVITIETYDYDTINLAYSKHQPGVIHCKDSAIVRYFTNYFLQRAISAFQFSGIPEHWDKNYFFTRLFIEGFMCIFNTDKFGIIPQSCGLGGINVFYMPTYCIVNNPIIKTPKEMYIGKDCELVRLTRGFRGIASIITNYADLAGLAMQSIAVSLVNTKNTVIAIAKDKAQAETIKKSLDEIYSGNPCVVVDKLISSTENGVSIKFEKFNIGENYITDKLLRDLREIENRFDTEIGVPNNAQSNKKERLIVDEVNMNKAETFAQATVWLECLKDSLKKVNEMFNLNIDVKLRWNNG